MVVGRTICDGAGIGRRGNRNRGTRRDGGAEVEHGKGSKKGRRGGGNGEVINISAVIPFYHPIGRASGRASEPVTTRNTTPGNAKTGNRHISTRRRDGEEEGGEEKKEERSGLNKDSRNDKPAKNEEERKDRPSCVGSRLRAMYSYRTADRTSTYVYRRIVSRNTKR